MAFYQTANEAVGQALGSKIALNYLRREDMGSALVGARWRRCLIELFQETEGHRWGPKLFWVQIQIVFSRNFRIILNL